MNVKGPFPKIQRSVIADWPLPSVRRSSSALSSPSPSLLLSGSPTPGTPATSLSILTVCSTTPASSTKWGRSSTTGPYSMRHPTKSIPPPSASLPSVSDWARLKSHSQFVRRKFHHDWRPLCGIHFPYYSRCFASPPRDRFWLQGHDQSQIGLHQFQGRPHPPDEVIQRGS